MKIVLAVMIYTFIIWDVHIIVELCERQYQLNARITTLEKEVGKCARLTGI